MEGLYDWLYTYNYLCLGECERQWSWHSGYIRRVIIIYWCCVFNPICVHNFEFDYWQLKVYVNSVKLFVLTLVWLYSGMTLKWVVVVMLAFEISSLFIFTKETGLPQIIKQRLLIFSWHLVNTSLFSLAQFIHPLNLLSRIEKQVFKHYKYISLNFPQL